MRNPNIFSLYHLLGQIRYLTWLSRLGYLGLAVSCLQHAGDFTTSLGKLFHCLSCQDKKDLQKALLLKKLTPIASCPVTVHPCEENTSIFSVTNA